MQVSMRMKEAEEVNVLEEGCSGARGGSHLRHCVRNGAELEGWRTVEVTG